MTRANARAREALDGGAAARAAGTRSGDSAALASERRGTMMRAWKWAR